MLYNVILFSKAGLPVFHKEFMPHDKIRPRILTGLITAMNERCNDIYGAPCCYLEFNTLSLSIVTNRKFSISCLLIYSKYCGEVFGKLIATELVESFCSEFGEQLQKLTKKHNHHHDVGGHGLKSVGLDEKQFIDFENKIAPAIKNSITPILEFLQSQKYINVAMLISSDQLLPHNHRVDAISFVSEYRSLIFQTKQIMSLSNEIDSEVIIHTNNSIIMIHKIENASLVLTINKNGNTKKTFILIAKYCDILQNILKLIASLGEYGPDTFQWSVNW